MEALRFSSDLDDRELWFVLDRDGNDMLGCGQPTYDSALAGAKQLIRDGHDYAAVHDADGVYRAHCDLSAHSGNPVVHALRGQE